MAKYLNNLKEFSEITNSLILEKGMRKEHAQVLEIICYCALIFGCVVEIENNMENGKLIFRLNDDRFFTIRAAKTRGLWIQFYDPDDTFSSIKGLCHDGLSDTDGQYNKYGTNKTEYFGSSPLEIKDSIRLLYRSINLKKQKPFFNRR